VRGPAGEAPRKRRDARSIFTAANLLTFADAAILFFVILLVRPDRPGDGREDDLGAWLDPMADKLLLVTMFVILTMPGLGDPNRLPLWFTILVISRDVAIVATVAVVNLAVGPRTFRPSIYGKIATALYIVTGVAALYYNYLGEPAVIVQALIWASLFITFVSAGHYAYQVARMRH
jgi:cardiolipin synthase